MAKKTKKRFLRTSYLQKILNEPIIKFKNGKTLEYKPETIKKYQSILNKRTISNFNRKIRRQEQLEHEYNIKKYGTNYFEKEMSSNELFPQTIQLQQAKAKYQQTNKEFRIGYQNFVKNKLKTGLPTRVENMIRNMNKSVKDRTISISKALSNIIKMNKAIEISKTQPISGDPKIQAKTVITKWIVDNFPDVFLESIKITDKGPAQYGMGEIYQIFIDIPLKLENDNDSDNGWTNLEIWVTEIHGYISEIEGKRKTQNFQGAKSFHKQNDKVNPLEAINKVQASRNIDFTNAKKYFELVEKLKKATIQQKRLLTEEKNNIKKDFISDKKVFWAQKILPNLGNDYTINQLKKIERAFLNPIIVPKISDENAMYIAERIKTRLSPDNLTTLNDFDLLDELNDIV